MLALIMVVLVGCTSADDRHSKHRRIQKRRQNINNRMALDVGPLNPHTYLPNQMTAQAMVYESLVAYNDDGTISPKLAESWDISDDKTAYVFHLRQDVNYSDGTVFNADNVIRNFDAVLANRDMHSGWGWSTILKKL